MFSCAPDAIYSTNVKCRYFKNITFVSEVTMGALGGNYTGGGEMNLFFLVLLGLPRCDTMQLELCEMQ